MIKRFLEYQWALSTFGGIILYLVIIASYKEQIEDLPGLLIVGMTYGLIELSYIALNCLLSLIRGFILK